MCFVCLFTIPPLTETFTTVYAADGRNNPARGFNKSRFGGLSGGRHPIEKSLPRHTPIVRNATDHREPSTRTGKIQITFNRKCNKINGSSFTHSYLLLFCTSTIQKKTKQKKEQLLLSVLPEHVAVKMRQDLGTAHDGQFKKIYMSRHENVRLVLLTSFSFFLNWMFILFDGDIN